MDLKSVKQLADLMDQRHLTYVEVQQGEHKIALSRQSAPLHTMAMPAMAPVAAPPTAPAAGPPPAATPAEPPAAKGEALESPIVGTVYMAPAPGQPPFVQVGQAVEKGQTLCIVEAMKVMNEFAAPRAGVVAEICVEDGQLVEFGQCLFRLA